MGKYGDVAALAVAKLRQHSFHSAPDAWREAAAEVFPQQEASRRKVCPKSAFLGPCEEGLVSGVPRGNCSAGPDNKAYAIEAVRLLRKDPHLASQGASALWTRVMDGREKKPNSQMDVVLTLWSIGHITR